MSSFVRNLEDRPRGLIKDFIYVKDNSLTKDFCIHVIKKFDEDPRKKDGVEVLCNRFEILRLDGCATGFRLRFRLRL